MGLVLIARSSSKWVPHVAYLNDCWRWGHSHLSNGDGWKPVILPEGGDDPALVWSVGTRVRPPYSQQVAYRIPGAPNAEWVQYSASAFQLLVGSDCQTHGISWMEHRYWCVGDGWEVDIYNRLYRERVSGWFNVARALLLRTMYIIYFLSRPKLRR